MATLRYRSLFISDTHLGLKAARSEYLLDFLKHSGGDWVESCTALAEHADGSLQLIHWSDESLQLLDKRVYANRNSNGCVASTS